MGVLFNIVTCSTMYGQWPSFPKGLSKCSRIVKIIHFACSSQRTACELAGKLINQIVRQVGKNGRNSFIVSVDASHWCNVHVSRAEILWNRILKMMHKLPKNFAPHQRILMRQVPIHCKSLPKCIHKSHNKKFIIISNRN